MPRIVTDGVKRLLSFDLLSVQGATCLMTNMTAVTKTAAQSAFVLYFFAVVLVIYLASGCCCICVRPEKRPRIGQMSLDARMLTTVVSLFLYTYQNVAENAFLLLNCTDIGATGSVLFYDGNVTCLQPWQYGVIVCVCIFILPFFTVLLFGPKLLAVGRISVFLFFMSFLFPLFFTVPMIVLFVAEYRKNAAAGKAAREKGAGEDKGSGEEGKTKPASGGDEDGLDGGKIESESEGVKDEAGASDLREAVGDVVTGAYRPDILGGVCWEGAINFRRMVLVLVFTFVNDVLLKHLALAGGCFVVLLVHLRAMPFKQRFSNIFESVSLSLLLVISGTNLVKSAFYHSQTIPRGQAYVVMVVFEWIEAVALGILPITLIVLLFITLVVKTGRKVWRRGHKHPSADSLPSRSGNGGSLSQSPDSCPSGNDRSLPGHHLARVVDEHAKRHHRHRRHHDEGRRINRNRRRGPGETSAETRASGHRRRHRRTSSREVATGAPRWNVSSQARREDVSYGEFNSRFTFSNAIGNHMRHSGHGMYMPPSGYY